MFSTRRSLLIAFVALNLSIGGLVSWFKFPIYLDSLGIFLATVLLGWRYGLVCALATVALGFFLVNPYLPFYVGTSIAIVFCVEALRRRNLYRNPLLTLASGLVLAVTAALVSAPVTAYLFGGATASGADLLTAYLLRVGRGMLDAVLLSGISSEALDKTLVTFIGVSILRGLPNTFLSRFSLRGAKDDRPRA